MSFFNFFKRFKKKKEIVLKTSEKCRNLTSDITLLVITDLHGNLEKELNYQEIIKNSKYDLCCILGDMSDSDYKIILKYVPKEKIVALLGNHDRFDLISSFGIKNINGDIIIINDLKIGGIEGSFRYKEEVFPSFNHEESYEFLKDMEEVDILLSHDKPFTENTNRPVHDGLKGITYYLYEKRVPYNIHGHEHESFLTELENGTKVKCVYGVELINLKKLD